MNKLKRRRIKKKISENKGKIIIIICALFILLLGTGYAVSTTLLSIDGSATIVTENKCSLDITGSYEMTNHWGNNDGKQSYFGYIRVTNNSSEDIQSWTIKIKGPSDMEIQTNANYTLDDGILTLTPYGWNSLIKGGNTFELSNIILTVENDFDPEYITFNGCKIYGKGTVSPDPEDPTVELTNIELSPSSYEMTVGETFTLTTTKTPSNASTTLVYSSSDSQIASVNEDGTVTALKEGNVTITVTSSNGLSSSSQIIVKKEDETPILPDGIELTFGQTGYWGDINYGQAMNFNITIKNNSENSINGCSFQLGLPSGTSYTIWTGSTTVTDGSFSYTSQIASNSSVIIYGQVTLPKGYDITKYLSPTITNIKVS